MHLLLLCSCCDTSNFPAWGKHRLSYTTYYICKVHCLWLLHSAADINRKPFHTVLLSFALFRHIFYRLSPVHTRTLWGNITLRYWAKPELVKILAIITFLCGVKLFNIGWCSVGEPPLLAVPEVTVRSVTPISAAFAAVFRVKRTVNPSEEAGGSQHYLQMLLSCPHESARSFFSASFSSYSKSLKGATEQ